MRKSFGKALAFRDACQERVGKERQLLRDILDGECRRGLYGVMEFGRDCVAREQTHQARHYSFGPYFCNSSVSCQYKAKDTINCFVTGMDGEVGKYFVPQCMLSKPEFRAEVSLQAQKLSMNCLRRLSRALCNLADAEDALGQHRDSHVKTDGLRVEADRAYEWSLDVEAQYLSQSPFYVRLPGCVMLAVREGVHQRRVQGVYRQPLNSGRARRVLAYSH